MTSDSNRTSQAAFQTHDRRDKDALLKYEGPDSVFDEVTEDDFRNALGFIVAISPPARNFPTLEAQTEAMMPYDSDYRRAKTTLELYAINVLGCDLEAMQACYRQYANDPAFYKDGLPETLVAFILTSAWAEIEKSMYARLLIRSAGDRPRH